MLPLAKRRRLAVVRENLDVLKARFEESKHPRAKNGEFTSGDGGSSSASGDTKTFSIRDSYAGNKNPTSHWKRFEEISKKYPSLKLLYQHDKGVELEMDAKEYKRFEREMTQAGIGYLIN